MTNSLNTSDSRPAPHGRSSAIKPPNRFLKALPVPDYADFDNDPEFLVELRRVPTEFLDDASRSIVSENDSPDVPFRYSVNPYRGCEHGCADCDARPYHEYLGLNAGFEFTGRVGSENRLLAIAMAKQQHTACGAGKHRLHEERHYQGKKQ